MTVDYIITIILFMVLMLKITHWIVSSATNKIIDKLDNMHEKVYRKERQTNQARQGGK